MKISKEKNFIINKKEKLHVISNDSGITLVALVVTIIVLLILAGVALSSVLSQDGIFHRAEQGEDKYGEAKARETLELALSEAQMQKYEEGLSDEQLDEKINEIGSLDTQGGSEVTVDKYIFEIDRSVPKIVGYIGESDGIIIRYKISGNDTWQRAGSAVNIGVTITIQDNGGLLNTSSIRILQDGVDITSGVNIGLGSFTLNTDKSTTYVVNASNSKGEPATPRTIVVNAKIDGIEPTVETVKAEADGMDIKINATGHDKNEQGKEESGIKQFSYTINSIDGIPPEKASGTFKIGETVTITSEKEATYTIIVKAEDNVGNITSTGISAEVTTINEMTLAAAKEKVNGTTLQQYIGTKISDYNPLAGGTWRVFYYDSEDDGNGNGYFGKTGTLYLKRDYDENLLTSIDMTHLATPEGINIMKEMNPKWRNSENSEKLDFRNEIAVSWLCEPLIWKNYKIDGISEYAIGGPSIEMYAKSYNIYTKNSSAITMEISSIYGYSFDVNDKITDMRSWRDVLYTICCISRLYIVFAFFYKRRFSSRYVWA